MADAGSTGIKRKKMSSSAEENQSKTRDVTKGNHSQNQDGMVESVERVVKEVENEEEEEEQQEESEGEKEKQIEEGGDFGTSNWSQTVVRIGTDVLFLEANTSVLDCSSCRGPFRPPIYQCENGHAICSPCCFSLSGKCPDCSQLIGLIRCLALESVIEALQIRCINARYGCNTTLSYLHRDTHHKICNYRPCTCPVSPCAFRGSSRSLSHHFHRHHRNSAVKFRYGHCFHAALNRTENPFLVLHGEDGRLFLLLNNNKTRGSALSMICISSRHEESNFEYELSVGEKTTLKLKTSVESTNEWKGVYPTEIFLFVPRGFFSSNIICVGVSINKC